MVHISMYVYLPLHNVYKILRTDMKQHRRIMFYKKQHRRITFYKPSMFTQVFCLR